MLSVFANRPVVTIPAVLLLCAIAALLVRSFGGEFLPKFREGHFVAHLNAIPGTSLEESRRLGAQVSRGLLGIEHVLTAPEQIGRAELGEDPWGPHRGEFHMNVTPNLGQREDDVQTAIRRVFEQVPGSTHDITTFLGDRIGETISGETASVVVSIFGDDLDLLDQKAEAVRQVLAGVRGAVDVQIASPPGVPQMMVRLRHDRLMQLGFRPVEVLDAIETAYQGTTVAQTFEGGRVFDIVVILNEALRREPESIGALLRRNAEGTRVPLREIADVYGTQGRLMLLHDGGRRRQTVTCNIDGRDVTSFVAEAKGQIVKRITFPAGTYPVFGGEAEVRAQAQQELLIHSGIAAVGIILLLVIVMGNFGNLLLVLVNLPFALVGGVVAIYLTSGLISIGALIGFVTVFGITTCNAIMMISHFQHLVTVEGMPWGLPAAVRGASERLIPILMTALVTGLGLLPIAVGADAAGREIEGPTAVVSSGILVLTYCIGAARSRQWGYYAVCLTFLTFAFLRASRSVSPDQCTSFVAAACCYLVYSACETVVRGEGQEPRVVDRRIKIIGSLGSFLGCFMIRKVIAGQDLKRAAGTVTNKLSMWLAAKGYISAEEAQAGADEGAEAARDLPKAERAAQILVDAVEDLAIDPNDLTDEDYLEFDHFTISKLAPGKLWLDSFEGGVGHLYGPVPVPNSATKLLREGWDISCSLGRVAGYVANRRGGERVSRVSPMAKQKKQHGTGQRPTKTASVLDRLRPEEAQVVLWRLLTAHRELRSEAQQIAKSLLGEVAFGWVADEVEEAVRDLGLDELGSRAGKHSWGYTEPSEAGWELLEERVSPFIEDMKRRFELGLDVEALEMCKGVVLGLYRVRNEQGDDVLQWVPDFPAETAAHTVATWRDGGDKKAAGRGRRKQRVFPPDFVKEFVPEWVDLIGRA